MNLVISVLSQPNSTQLHSSWSDKVFGLSSTHHCSGENGKKGLFYLAEVFSGGFGLYEHNKSEKKLFKETFSS